ncbi:MAG: HAMP domain-containing histidine kinase [Thermodesulfobacteria bacterium]|nr:HAMP domain-containing histidine kinase [Thermodesulfobacteriota bacterium]
MTIYCAQPDPPELATVLSRIRKKKEDYERYNFTATQGRALRAFFDLAQEFETLDNFYRIAVFVPKIFMDFDSCLYLVDSETSQLKRVCDSLNALGVCGMDPPEGVRVSSEPYEHGDSFFAPIRGNKRLFAAKVIARATDVIGMFEVFPKAHLTDKDKLFFEKYANRIGYNLHYKLLARQNEEHIKFINTLVADIEHNVIAPNIKYKYFLKLIDKKIKELDSIMGLLRQHLVDAETCNCPKIKQAEEVERRLESAVGDLRSYYQDMKKHFENTSLFLESLLRREHFQKGELVLRRRSCNFRKEVIEPQLERYKDRLARRGITIDNQLGGVPDEDFPLAVDIGLISQVYANLFSNAEKYCQEVTDENGNRIKFMAYGRQVLPDYFGPGQDGIKFNVFTTGPHLSPEDAERIFDEGFRASDTADSRPGTGHGLHFVKKIVEVHGGVVGYEPVPLGNNFYFILPLKKEIS